LTFRDTTFAGCAAFALVGLMLHALVDFPLQVLALQAYAGVYLGLAWGSGRWQVEQREPPATPEIAVPAVREEIVAESFKYN
jgi:hypothetical protein